MHQRSNAGGAEPLQQLPSSTMSQPVLSQLPLSQSQPSQQQHAPSAQPSQQPKEQQSESLQRLQDIEQHVIAAVEAAAGAMEEMSNLGAHLDKAKVQQHCEQFLKSIQAAQELVLKGAENPIADREFKATVYNAMSRAHLAHEKVQAVSMQLAAMMHTVEQHEARQRQQRGMLADDEDVEDAMAAAAAVDEVMTMQMDSAAMEGGA